MKQIKRNWKDSMGNRARIILLSELPEYILDNYAYQKWREGESKRAFQKVLKKKHLKCLTEKQLEAVIMVYWGQMKVKEAARRLKVTVQAVYKRLWRAYERLEFEIKV